MSLKKFAAIINFPFTFLTVARHLKVPPFEQNTKSTRVRPRRYDGAGSNGAGF